jgi:hypothetical protein
VPGNILNSLTKGPEKLLFTIKTSLRKQKSLLLKLQIQSKQEMTFSTFPFYLSFGILFFKAASIVCILGTYVVSKPGSMSEYPRELKKELRIIIQSIFPILCFTGNKLFFLPLLIKQ